jgi:DDE superfamily endonuclease
MAPPHRVEALQKEGRMDICVNARKKNQISSGRTAAGVFKVSESTLRLRLQGIPPRLGSRSKFRLLSETEESVLIGWISSMERRGFPPFLIDVTRMAQTIIDKRGSRIPARRISDKWIYKFLDQHPELDKRLARNFDNQRAKTEDPKIINEWFQRVKQTKEEHGILDEDTYNFDETGVAIGIAHLGSSKVVTTEATVGRASVIQPGDRKWVTIIECINAMGWTIPPYLILDGRIHLEYWYQVEGLSKDWRIAVSDNGWTTNDLGFRWIQHFNKWTKDRTIGRYRLLILDGHSSHTTPEFDQFCTDNRIITLCMPSHSSHILQPLDVACFSPLKAAYGKLVNEQARNGVFHIDKAVFLHMYMHARQAIHSEQNITSGFRATGLIPFSPERVLSALTITKTPSPPSSQYGDTQSPWTSETPRNQVQIDKQMLLVQDAYIRQSQSPTEPMAKVAKSASIAWNMVALQAQEIAKLRATNEQLQQKKKRSRKQLQHGGDLEVQEAQNLILARQEVEQQQEATSQTRRRQRAPRTCSRCGSLEHTARTCNLVNYAT